MSNIAKHLPIHKTETDIAQFLSKEATKTKANYNNIDYVVHH